MIKIISLGLTLVLATLTTSASAFELKPLYTALSPSGAGAERVFRVTNTNDKPIAVQFNTTTRQQNPDGTEKQVAADNLFMIYPPQAVIPAHKTQKVRVQWLGQQNPKKELAYRFVAEQVPVNLSKGKKTGVQMVMTLVGSIYIEPKGVKHQLSVSNLHQKGNQLAFTIKNSGTKHALLEGLKMDLLGDGQQLKLSGEQVAGADGKNILAGAYRHFSIPYPQSAKPNKSWQAKLHFYE